MSEKTICYGKDPGKSIVPLTMRIEWLPDGKIVPLLFWTPDGTCFKVIILYECISCAFLKDRGVGLRFKVRARLIETPDPGDERIGFQYETYLYLADKRFSEKNIIDGRYGHAAKEYIFVTLDIFSDGSYEIVYFSLRGARFQVEKTLCAEPRGSFEAGGVGLWHKVEARLINAEDDGDPDPLMSVRCPAALYLELNKWFVHICEEENEKEDRRLLCAPDTPSLPRKK